MAPDTDALVRELTVVGRSAPPAGVDPALVERVMARVAELPAPAHRGAVRLAGDRLAAASGRRRRLVASAAVVLVVLLLTPPVRAAVSDWFGFAGVRVRQGVAPSATAGPREVTGSLSLEEAQRLVGFTPVVPAALGSPDAVAVSRDRRVLSMSWSGGADGTVRLDTFDARVDFTFAKTAPGAEFTVVGGAFAVWIDGPHEVVLLREDGTRPTVGARLAGSTLVWERGTRGLRLEGDLSMRRAVEIAESVRPVP